MIDIELINRIVNIPWPEHINFELDPETKKFVEQYLSEHYLRVYKGLFSYDIEDEERERYYKELHSMLVNYSGLILKSDVQRCIAKENSAEHDYIDHIFKLQSCHNIEW